MPTDVNNPCYKILQPIGQGQDGQTFLAQTTSSEPVLVVIKHIYTPQEPLDALTKRLRSVGQHPQLPALIDNWHVPDGQFFAFEYIAVPSIVTAQPPPWSPAQVETWLLSLLPVLEHLHSFRLVHGDIRPANIRQLQPPILVDLRITQRLDRQTPALSSGDAAYAAPEQTLGQLVYASDLYSLGLVAIHLLTGLPPFDLYSIAENRWIWPDLVTTPTPKPLSHVLHKLLERNLDKRYTSAAQTFADLKKTTTRFLIDKALSRLPPLPLSSSPPPLPSSAKQQSKPIPWQPLYQLTPGITTALALQGRTLAMGTNSGAIFICDLKTDDELSPLNKRHRDRITALALHPQRQILYSASSDGTIKLWDLTNGTLKDTLSQPGWQPTDLAVSDSFLIVSDGSGYITLWDLDQLTPHHSFSQHQDWVTRIAASGDRLASISRDRTLRIWSLSEKRLLDTLSINNSQGLAIHPSGNYVIIGNDRGQVNVWPVANQPAKPTRLCAGSDSITTLALSPDARLLAVGTDGNALRVYEGASGQCVSELAQGWGVMALAFNGKILVSSSQDETVTIWQRAIQ
ncbi:MAG: hypothetical protein AAGA83_11710 [Cyanobacteria bacterium P01_F01_bin.116]